MKMDKEYFMKKAVHYARLAASKGETPVGAVVVRNDEIVSFGYNKRESKKNALCHAEIMAIDRACRKLGGWRLWECDIYVTLEPCPMCAGAIINARVERVVYGAPDHKAGAFGTMLNLTDYPLFKPQITSGVLADECASILTAFFKKKR